MSHSANWDVEEARALLHRDREFRPLLRAVGSFEVTRRRPYFWSLARAILFQQVSTAAGRSITARVRALLDGARFPRPEDLLSVPAQQLRGAGVSRQKARYLHALAEAFHTGELADVRFSRLPDEEILRRLTAIVGIGRWTAEMFLMFSMRRPDIFPIDDLGIRRGMGVFFGVGEPEEMVERAEPWRPYRSLASMYLWRAQDTGLVS